jgi:hypothetical protein
VAVECGGVGMKILMVADSIMLHLEREEACLLVDALNVYKKTYPACQLIADIVRQIDICLNAKL